MFCFLFFSCPGGTGKSGKDGTIPAGQRLYPFVFQLPQNLPSTFESLAGHVRYSVKCNIQAPQGKDICKLRFFNVVSVYDLNEDISVKASFLVL